jgi:predicted Holliday junction resolvase-like endonuclease
MVSMDKRRRNLSFFFLLILVVAEINNISATVTRAQQKIGKGPHVVATQKQQRTTKTNEQKLQLARQEKENDKKEEEAENEKREKPSDEEDQKGSFVRLNIYLINILEATRH